MCVCMYLLIATVRASGELAQGQMTSDFKPLDWKTLRKASQDEIDPERKEKITDMDAAHSKLGAFCALGLVCQAVLGI